MIANQNNDNNNSNHNNTNNSTNNSNTTNHNTNNNNNNNTNNYTNSNNSPSCGPEGLSRVTGIASSPTALESARLSLGISEKRGALRGFWDWFRVSVGFRVKVLGLGLIGFIGFWV